MQITATRFGEQVQEVPGAVSVITGEELIARGATDLRTALALLGGVTVAPGGDAGPSGSVPGLLGLREVDDLLLLIDGIPAGGAFVPQFEVLSLNNVERIEVLRGTAPVYFGTTAFAGTINVVHFPAGRAGSTVTVSYGSHGSASVQGSAVLSGTGIRQSLSAEIVDDRLSDSRAGSKRALAGYRLATPLAGGELRADLNLTALHQRPASPTPVTALGNLNPALPVDFNQNPADARLNTERYQVVLAYDKALDIGQWGSTVSFTRSSVHSTRGFLIGPDGAQADDEDAPNAQGSLQARQLTDVFIDTHLTSRLSPTLAATFGVNELFGRARQDSRVFGYTLPLDGSGAPNSITGTPLGSTTLADRRSFFGLYAQTRWQITPASSLLAGLRWNHVQETRETAGAVTGAAPDGAVPRRSAAALRAAGDGDGEGDPGAVTVQHQRTNRLSGSLGAQVKVWQDAGRDLDDLTLHASIGNTFQPPQIDFGPDAGGEPLLRPETQRSLEFGLKADGDNGRLEFDITAFLVDFQNQAMSTLVDGNPALVSGGTQRFRGLEIEGSYRLRPTLTLSGHLSHNDARYRDTTTLVDGTPTSLAGHSLVMSPRVLAGAGVVFAPERGWRASLTTNYVGRRYLDAQNTAAVAGYVIADATIGYSFDRCSIVLSAANLGDRRDAVLPSELGEGQFYRLPGRRLALGVTLPLR